jgi:hypothetical protein
MNDCIVLGLVNQSPTMLKRVLVLSVSSVVACTHVAPTPADVAPGVAVRFETGAAVDTVVYARSIHTATQDSSAGRRTVVLRVERGSSRVRLLEVEQRFPAGGGIIVDTAVAELPSLRAVAHQSHQPTRTMRFEFGDAQATGVVTPRDSAGRTVHQNVGGPIFDSNILDLVIASLPLRTGLTVELPFFIYERGGRVPMSVSVRERATVDFGVLGRRDAWVVSVGVPGAPATVWVDARTRAVLRTRYDIAARHFSMIDERVTPLPAA